MRTHGREWTCVPSAGGKHPIYPTTRNAACRFACAAARLGKYVTVYALQHSFAAHLLESGTDIRIIQSLLGHRNVNTAARYAQVATSTIRGTPSTLEHLESFHMLGTDTDTRKCYAQKFSSITGMVNINGGF